MKTHARGTGEHDYALLRITRDDLITSPSLPFDTREGIGFPGDTILAASYPAEFIGARGTAIGLYPISSTAPIEELLTFKKNKVDLFTLGGIIGAQAGSSGGPVVNAWGHVIGIITSTSEAPTTTERELRALTLSYVDRDLKVQSGQSLKDMLSGDAVVRAAHFRENSAGILTQLLIDQILSSSR
jgi:hypothetical protein